MKMRIIAMACGVLLLVSCHMNNVDRAEVKTVQAAPCKLHTLREAQMAKFSWYDPESFLLIASQYLIKKGLADIVTRARSQGVWVNDDVAPPEVIVMFWNVYWEGPNGPQNYEVTIRPNGAVVGGKPSYWSM